MGWGVGWGDGGLREVAGNSEVLMTSTLCLVDNHHLHYRPFCPTKRVTGRDDSLRNISVD